MTSDENPVAGWRDLAVSLARGAGELARRAQGEGWPADPPIEVDVERRMVHGITGRFRDHAVVSRLRRSGPEDADVVWFVDPLDGAENYAIGLDLHGVSIAVVVDGEVVVGVVHDSVSGRTCSAVRGGGAEREGAVLGVRAAAPLPEATVSWIGRPSAVSASLEGRAGRVLRTDAPSADWALLAAGGTHAVVVGTDDPWALDAGLLLATEAGASHERTADHVVVGPPELVAEILTLL